MEDCKPRPAGRLHASDDPRGLKSWRPGGLNHGSGRAGSSICLAGELLGIAAGIELTHVPYKGGAPALAALNRAIDAVLNDPDYRSDMGKAGVELVGGGEKEFRAYLEAERKKWAAPIQKRGIKAE